MEINRKTYVTFSICDGPFPHPLAIGIKEIFIHSEHLSIGFTPGQLMISVSKVTLTFF